MAIKRIEVENFSAFQKLKVEFSPGLNVFIGENSTGKSHLMKLLYCLMKSQEDARFDLADAPKRQKMRLHDKLVGVFKPEDDRLGRLVNRRVGRLSAKVSLRYDGNRIGFSLSSLDVLRPVEFTAAATPPSIFLPSREALAMYEGFVAAYENRELSFDETYFDLCKALSASPLRGPRLGVARQLLEALEDVLGGRVVRQGGRFYVRSERGLGNIEAHLLAEGYRKIASLARLIANGSLMKNAILFWDEPEANLNPRLVTKVALVLRSLAARGVQIFLATHDFLLSSELSLAVEYKTKPAVPTRFFCFSRKTPTASVDVEWADQLADLEQNPILREFAAHYDRERGLFSAGVGESKP